MSSIPSRVTTVLMSVKRKLRPSSGTIPVIHGSTSRNAHHECLHKSGRVRHLPLKPDQHQAVNVVSCETWVSRSGDYEHFCTLGCNGVKPDIF